MSVFEEQQKKRFQFLSYVYESTEANTEKHIYLRDITKGTGLSESEVVSIANYLLNEKGFILCDTLLGLSHDVGIVWISTKGITEVEAKIQSFEDD